MILHPKTIDCPKCGSMDVICGSPNFAYDPMDVRPAEPLWRTDSCLRCHHRWTVDYPRKPVSKLAGPW